ncbi:unnamed protein product [Penicillium salamii]|nr:unnamed protein product [Penicillium salamii]CAG8245617.1 unnamed protein product [Penicillium salamii]
MSDFQPIHFVPAARQSQMSAMAVERIIAVPHEKITNENIGSTNHWYLYLATPSQTSIRVDCQPSHTVPSTVIRGGSKANLVVSESASETETDAQEKFHLDVAAGLTMGDILGAITRNGRHKYEFDENGVGCRFWTTDLIDLLYQHQIATDATQVARAKAGILKLWPDQTPLALDQGAYYS